MKLSEKFRRAESGSINKIFAAQSVEALEAEIEETNARCQRLTIENDRLRQIVGCTPQEHADRARPITLGDLDSAIRHVIAEVKTLVLAPEIRIEQVYPTPADDSIIEGGRGITRADGSVNALPFLESLDGPLTFGRMLRSIRLGEDEGVADFAVKLCIPVEDLEPIENDRASVSDEQATEFAKILGYSESQFVRLARSQRLGRLVGADRIAP